MNYNKYKDARDAAWRILIDERIKELPVPIVKICRDLDISVKVNTALRNKVNSGQSMIINDKAFVFVAPDCPNHRLRFTVAHELGHIVLGHVGKYDLVNREPSPNDNPIEQEANVFASRILAPACVLWGLRVSSAKEISDLCDISLSAATSRFERYQLLLKRDRFLTSPLEQEVYDLFSDFIQAHQASD